MRALLAVLIWLASTGLAVARCDGTDLRPTLSPAQEAALADTVAAMPYPRGNHWIATRGAARIHLLGTMHVDDPRFAPIVARLDPVIAGAGLLLLEATGTEQAALTARLATDPSLFVLQDTTLPELMTEADWTSLSDAAAARGIPGFMAAKMKPWYLALILAMPPCMAADLGAADGLDAQLEALADAAGTPTRALEDPMTVFAAFEEAPLAEQTDMILPSIMAPDDAENMFATLRAAYFEQETALGWALSAMLAAELSPAGPEMIADAMAQTEAALLHDRNRAWMPVILDAVDTTAPAPVVVAVGAAHLPGTDGLLALLDAEGFDLARAPF